VSTVDDVKMLLEAGADKVSVNSAAVKHPELINEISARFGSQCLVVAIDAKQINVEWIVHLVGGKVPTSLNLFSWASEAEKRGAGEVLFTSMNNDGTKDGYAIEALQKLNEMLSIPVIASGGAGSIKHIEDAFLKGQADAALAASIFHFSEISIQQLKNELTQSGIPIRITK